MPGRDTAKFCDDRSGLPSDDLLKVDLVGYENALGEMSLLK